MGHVQQSVLARADDWANGALFIWQYTERESEEERERVGEEEADSQL